jgi:signal transduction histidine kinase
MRRGNVLAGSAFQSAVSSLAVFIAILLLLGGAIYTIMSNSMISDVDGSIIDEVELFQEIYARGGQEELIQTISQFETPAVAGIRAAGLFDRQGKHLAGNIAEAPDFELWTTRTFDDLLPKPVGTYRLYAYHIASESGLKLVVSHNIDNLVHTQWRLLQLLIAAGAIVTAVSVAAGYVLSRSTFRKLEAMSEALGAVSRGDMSRRIPVGRQDDQIDRIASRINVHLDQLSTLTDTTKNTINAIAHDLRAPLNRASIHVQEALDVTADATVQDRLSNIESDLDGLVDIFEAIMRIARIESESGDGGMRSVPLNELMAEICDTFEAVIEDAGQTLVVEEPRNGDGAKLYGDERMLRQMLANLIGNASRHSPVGSTIILSHRQLPNGSTRMQVADNGPGIPAEMRTQVLKPFQRLEASRSTPGSGLGLALVSAIATRHRALLALDDNEPGLRVTIDFPPSPN